MCGASTIFSLGFLVLVTFRSLSKACQGDEVPRDVLLDWFKQHLLDGLGLEKPPEPSLQASEGGKVRVEVGHGHRRATRVGRAAWAQDHRRHHQENHEQVILFPSTDSTCGTQASIPEEKATRHFTYYFQPSAEKQQSAITSAHFWFYAGEGSTNVAPLFILTSDQKLLQVAEAPTRSTPDGWTTYHLQRPLHASLAQGPFVFQVRCPSCDCTANEADKTPFLHLHTHLRSPDRSPRQAVASIPWSPSAINLLMRPAQEKPDDSDCKREEINISFEELGWDNWIVHPKVFTFYYCHGTCSSLDRTTAVLGIKQCCAPVPGTMKSLRFTTTSDGGYSFKYETLPNIIPEECACI
ncbi:hypothetical protein DPEC_G00155630 [Dallia pectoralis]|uniref:Uncharacterized protein n=1 Tax=Dallia pectoralis TaxID=75939 RepID=A0ACC2GL01_DALPE|nr:hypothetical protein DPEC_G00155630 [Dallia pectoralis]